MRRDPAASAMRASFARQEAMAPDRRGARRRRARPLRDPPALPARAVAAARLLPRRRDRHDRRLGRRLRRATP
ncbi:MAG: hypothetical protein MZW92_05055 [Comamonadaceae bacterium]|nr:hypothetical protein [Comamonadaceae bacterium]